MIVNATVSDFDSIISEYSKVVVDFWATWCGPCKMIAPILQEISDETTNVIVKVDADANTELVERFGIQSIPTLVLFENGQPVRTLVGYNVKSKILEFIGA